ncbi:MAG: hypothetical protein M1436_08865 [Acidobacteria bacterium]|nr:hypothetical protein [Acidobacteriota bacterium]
MKRKLITGGAAALLFLTFSVALPAKDTVPKPGRRQVVRRTAKSSKTDRRLAASSVIAELLGKNFTIEANGSKVLDSAYDFGGAEGASIAVAAPEDVDIANDKLNIQVWWAVPDAEWYVLQDTISGANFHFANQGGGVVPVYGSYLRVVITNDGENPVSVDQVTVYAVVH